MEKQLTTTNGAAVTNQQPMTAKALFGKDEVKRKFDELLGKRSSAFITSVLQIVASNALLAKADPTTIYQAAALAATLDLPLNNALGFAYIIPFNQKFKDSSGNWSSKQVAQFQIGYKGFIQLALRSGQFKTIAATEILEGQIVKNDPLEGFEFDFTVTSDKVVGYAAYFELLNGFKKTLYMTVDQIKAHGQQYSQNFSNDKSLWKTKFESMATKTVLKLLISKYAPLSVEMQKAVIADQAVIQDADTMDTVYIDNVEVVDKELERIQLMINDAKTKDELKALESFIPDDLIDLYNHKLEELKK